MFDVSFTELLVIGVVALVVIGPERLPRVARTVGHLLGRFQRYVSTVKADINREMHIEDLRKFEEEMKTSARSFETQMNAEVRAVEQQVTNGEADAAATAPAALPETAAAASGPVPPAPTFSDPPHATEAVPATATEPPKAATH